MKCAACQKSLLLVLSHEAGWWRRRQVERHLRTCQACRQFREQYIRLKNALEEMQPRPDERAVQTVLEFARREASRTQSAASRWASFRADVLFRPAWVYATLSVLALLTFFAIIEPVRRQAVPQVAQWPVAGLPPANPVANDLEIAVDVEGRLDELAWWLDVTTVDLFAASTLSDISWEDTEQLAAELLKLEDAQI